MITTPASGTGSIKRESDMPLSRNVWHNRAAAVVIRRCRCFCTEDSDRGVGLGTRPLLLWDLSPYRLHCSTHSHHCVQRTLGAVSTL